jgi:membrane fusion protein, multidrug efflux system
MDIRRLGDSDLHFTPPGVWVVGPKTGKLTLTPVQVKEYRHDRAGTGGNELVVRVGVHKLDPAIAVRIRETPR